MEYSRYVGRIGALAVALGVGVAIAAPAGVAWAEPEDSSAPSSSSIDTGDADTSPGSAATSNDTATGGEQVASGASEGSGATDGASAPQNEQSPGQGVGQSPSSSTVEVAPGVTVSSSGGSHTSADTQKSAKYGTRSLGSKKAAARTTHVTAQTNVESGEDVKAETVATAKTAAPAAAAEVAAADIVPITLNVAQPRVTKPVPSSVTVLLRSVVQPILSSILGAIPQLPTESPLAWVFLAAARRQIGVAEPEIAQAATFAVTTALVENQAPTIGTPVIDAPVAVTGVVTGQVIATDPEGQALTYTLTAPPPGGKLVFDSAAAKFTYTPTTSQRISAGVTSGVDTVAMTVTVSDGTTSVPAVINIPVSPTWITNSGEIGAVNDAHAVVVTATRAYVTNRTAGTVTVIDTTTNSVIATIAVGPTPDSLAIKPDGTKLYVASLANNTVKVVDTATRAVTATISMTTPSAMAVNSSGSTLYVTSLDTGKVVKIATSTNTVSGVVTLPSGSRPTGIAVSPDKTKIYVTSSTATGGTVAVFAYTSTTVTTITNLTSAPTALAVSPDNKRLYVSSADGKIAVVDTTTRAVLATRTVAGVPAGVTVSKDGSMLVVTDTAGRVSTLDAVTGSLLGTYATRTSTSPMSVAPATVASPDGKRLYVTDFDADKVYTVTLVPPNNPPTAGTPTFNPPSATMGAVTGTVGVTDVDRDALTYTVTGKPTKGALSLKTDGTFTYTPTATARHAASAVNAPLSAKTDSVAVSVSDGRGGFVTATVTVNISPVNKAPTYTLTVGTPSSTTGLVTGKVTASDADYDVRTLTASTPAKGAVVVTSTGAFTYTPTAQARHAAAKLGATTADKQDTFTITINDGHGGVVPVAVTVAVSPTNSAPTGATVGNVSINLHSGVVTGTVTATDVNNDPFSFTSTTPTKGTLVFGSNGAFTYTPTDAARQAASAPGATTATRTDAVTVTVADGYGGTTTVAMNLPVQPYGNSAPTNGHAVAGDPTTAIGEVRGTVVADDAENDTLTYVLATGPSKGVVNIDSSGAFRYVPNVEARWGAKTTPGVDTDSFAVTVSDGQGGTTTFTVSVTIAPPSTSTIDQRGTTVAMNVQELYFANQTDTNRALDLLKAHGVNTIRIMIPWAGVEASDDVWTWSAIDRVVNAAVARDMEVQAFLNSPPGWAVVPGTSALGGPPADNQEYAEFVGMVATRYAGKISAYEVWNEPNYYKFWEPAPNAAQYTALLKAAYTAIKAADPNAVVIGGVIAAAPDSGTQFVNSARFVTEMYAAGAAGYFDALSFHPYHYYVKFSQGGGMPSSPLTLVNQIHDVMVANGDGNKKIWATEYGEPSSLASEAGQAAFIDDFLSTWRDLDYAGPAFIHDVHDYFTLDPIAASFGVYRLDWSPKPAVGVIETVIDENEAFLAGGGGIEL